MLIIVIKTLLLQEGLLSYQFAQSNGRCHPFFEGENNPNVALLEEILMTYVMYNFDLGYVQVTDLQHTLSPHTFPQITYEPNNVS